MMDKSKILNFIQKISLCSVIVGLMLLMKTTNVFADPTGPIWVQPTGNPYTWDFEPGWIATSEYDAINNDNFTKSSNPEDMFVLPVFYDANYDSKWKDPDTAFVLASINCKDMFTIADDNGKNSSIASARRGNSTYADMYTSFDAEVTSSGSGSHFVTQGGKRPAFRYYPWGTDPSLAPFGIVEHGTDNKLSWITAEPGFDLTKAPASWGGSATTPTMYNDWSTNYVLFTAVANQIPPRDVTTDADFV